MEPIISPWVVYFYGISGPLVGLFTVIGVASLILTFASRIVQAFLEGNDVNGVDTAKKIYKWARNIFFVTFPLWIFIPSQETIVWMIVASQTTPKNIRTVLSTGKDIKNEFKNDFIDIQKEFFHAMSEAIHGTKENSDIVPEGGEPMEK